MYEQFRQFLRYFFKGTRLYQLPLDNGILIGDLHTGMSNFQPKRINCNPPPDTGNEVEQTVRGGWRGGGGGGGKLVCFVDSL